ncbi:hypothetical protein [Pyxidicoccus trucidator]|uniref:hypothetical protein n=1 Tax=Pyxidicoccus trucidator TaxID=2709662 RepID=UPI0013DA8798|nr:hypothetical protein [Pyxidicoccus trucidator]
MQAKRLLGSVLLAGLMSGCGGAVADESAETAALESREDALPSCNGQDYERIFYREPEKLTEVGAWYCFCGDNSVWTNGRTSAYSEYTYRNYCS